MLLKPFELSYQELRGKAFIKEKLIAEFEALPLPDPKNPNIVAHYADHFFEEFGVGSSTLIIDRPFERMKDYEYILLVLQKHNSARYQLIHKGTPYYFLGWLAFQMEDFERGVFYFDLALVEDMRKDPQPDIEILKQSPAFKMYLLIREPHTAMSTAVGLINEVEALLTWFEKFCQIKVTKEEFVNKFVVGQNHAFQPEFRTLVTSFYSFLLEYKLRLMEIELRGTHGSSLEPFYLHMFKGCLILETILKSDHKASIKIRPQHKTLGSVLNDLQTELNINVSNLHSDTFDSVVNHYIQLLQTKTPKQDIFFAAAYGVRNTTGHSLLWPDKFTSNPELYGKMVQSIAGAILWAIKYLWID